MRLPIDFLFRSLAEEQKEHAICIVLSGTGSDGTMALREVNAAGGLTIVQDPATAKYDGMPRSAVESGYADYVLPPERMPEQLLTYIKNFGGLRTREMPVLPDRLAALAKIVRMLRAKTGHDFSLYKKNTIFRRIDRRMTLLAITDMALYHRYLQERPGEAERLFKEILIRVTSFFRDPEAFAALKAKVLPPLLDGKNEGYPLRVWVPGCASGEEVYSIAICRFRVHGGDEARLQRADIRDRHRRGGDQHSAHWPLPARYRILHVPRAAQALLQGGQRTVQGDQADTGERRLRGPGHREGPSLHAARPRLLQEPPHLSRNRAAE